MLQAREGSCFMISWYVFLSFCTFLFPDFKYFSWVKSRFAWLVVISDTQASYFRKHFGFFYRELGHLTDETPYFSFEVYSCFGKNLCWSSQSSCRSRAEQIDFRQSRFYAKHRQSLRLSSQRCCDGNLWVQDVRGFPVFFADLFAQCGDERQSHFQLKVILRVGDVWD